MEKNFYFSENILHAENLNLQEFAANHPTPFYLYSQSRIEQNCQAVINAGKGLDFLPCFALKANYNPALLKLIKNMGFGADVVSGGELVFALKAGFAPSKIVFAGVGKTAEEIRLAIESRIHSINIESIEEFKVVQKIAEELEIPTGIAFRINPDIEAPTHDYIATGKHINKFGITFEDALPLYRAAAKHPWLKPVGLHIHIGSQILEAEPFLKAADYLIEKVDFLRDQGLPVTVLDLGGGIGIDYTEDFFETTRWPLPQILSAFVARFKGLEIKLLAELGRAIVGDAGLLITKVLYKKQTPLKKFVIVDAGMNNLLRPSLYRAYHPIVPLQRRNAPAEIVDVVGPVCESGDFFAQDRKLQAVEQGDFLAIGGAGAYGQALASNYNLRPLIPEYLVKDTKVKTIFKGERIEQIAQKFEW
ncbi:diaminopimelate decarboxylase [Caldithrix abyssi DSM 13497]|uniref:Diaminopimelate decarboxylase n=1 Tax=Caldithrix abyssi DSM 13497 TaxID=880073 RepID=H1XUA3_CALAY|nr:diaminopimelate decarboxylase [Caldithrix abyssi]APF17493.1 lysA diaminopimelate decarboxylase [Caldithrix abyssi DSM 13497]EHO41593.1 diaminopimelate decarboxylase [Caldithrix abyssi DSM 13497]